MDSLSAPEPSPGKNPSPRSKRVLEILSAIVLVLVGLLALRRALLLSVSISSGFIFLDAYFQNNNDSRAQAVSWVVANWQEPVDQVTPSGIWSQFSTVMEECSFGSLETSPPILGCKPRHLISLSTSLAPSSIAALLPVPEIREPDTTPLAGQLPLVKVWLGSWYLVTTLVGSVAAFGGAGVLVFLPAAVLAALTLAYVFSKADNGRSLILLALTLQLFILFVGIFAIGVRAVVLLTIVAIQWTLQSVVLINIMIQALDKIGTDRESAALHARIIGLERRFPTI